MPGAYEWRSRDIHIRGVPHFCICAEDVAMVLGYLLGHRSRQQRLFDVVFTEALLASISNIALIATCT